MIAPPKQAPAPAPRTIPPRPARSGAVPGAVVVALAFAAYANALANGFVYDDLHVTVNNPLIRSLENVPGFFTSSFWPGDQQPNYYRPLPNVVSTLAYALFGLEPWGHHLVNVLLHAGASLLAFLVARRLPLASRDGAGFLSVPLATAAIFATHPIHTEAVTWVAGLPDLSYSFFFLLAFFLHQRARDGAAHGYAPSAAAFFLAALCKEPALTFPLVVAAYDWIAREREPLRVRAARYLPLAVAACAYLALRVNALGGFAPVAHKELAAAHSAANAFVLFAKYLGKLLLPLDLNAIHVLDPYVSFGEPRALLGLAVTAGFVTAAVVAAGRRSPALPALAFVAGPLLPVLYAAWISGVDFGERFLYLPTFGFAVLVALALQTLAARVSPRAALATGGALLAAYSSGTVARNRVWRSDYTLYSDVAAKSPTLPAPHAYVGYAEFREGRDARAREHLRTAMALDPGFARSVPESLNAMGNERSVAGDLDGAIRHYRLALELEPASPDARSNLGVAYAQQGRLREAVAELEKALELQPGDEVVERNLAIARESLARSGREER